MDGVKTAYEELYDLKKSIKEDMRYMIDDFIKENSDYDKDNVLQKIDYNGQVTETVDSTVPIYNSVIMQIGSLPSVYQHENEFGPAFDGTPTPVNIIATAIYEILQETAWEFIRKYLDELEEDGKFDEDEDEDEEDDGVAIY